MIPILFEHDETSFTSNGIGRLAEAIGCEVTEERNGIYELALRYPATGRHYADIMKGIEDNNGQYGRIIYATHDDTQTPQPFDLYRHDAPIDGIVTFYAHHISYRLSRQVLKPFTASSASDAISKIAPNVIGGTTFTFWTDKTSVANMSLETPKAVRDQLGGVEGSLLDVYGGGEYEWDKFAVKLYQNRGTETGVEIRYGKNLTNLTQTYDTTNLYNAVVPYYKPGAEGELVMASSYIVSKASELGQEERAVPLDLTDQFSSAPTSAQLEAKALSWLNTNTPWLPNDNISVSFVALWQTPEYANIAPLQRLKLCDKVNVVYPALGVKATNKQIVRVVYDTLLERYKSMEIGKPQTTVVQQITNSVTSAVIKNVPTWSTLDQAIDSATELITGGRGGYLVITQNANGEPEELLLMDNPDSSLAVKVLRINRNGIGFSSDGINGPYETAWTIDKHFVADYIDTGTLNANVIKAGTITGVLGDSYWNLDTGELYISITSDDGQVAGLSQVVKVNADGLHIGKAGTTGEVVIDSQSVNVVMAGQRYSQFASNYVQFGNYQLRRTADGGLAFKMRD